MLEYPAMADTDTLTARTLEVMETNWNPQGYTSPNPHTYPWQWLWDSCFHAIIWTELEQPGKALAEMETLLATMLPTGFLPHMNYQSDPDAAIPLWGQPGASTITQPPMFGHALAHMARRGVDIPEELLAKAALGLRFFIRHRLDDTSGLIRLVHPWESGTDDNPRWDGYYKLAYRTPGWQEEKKSMLQTILRDINGTPVANPRFMACSPYFTALVAFNIQEAASITDKISAAEAEPLVAGVAASWDDSKTTWVDQGPEGVETGAEDFCALLCCLADRTPGRMGAIVEKIFAEGGVYAGRYGPAGISREHKVYDGNGYWRGGVWPQMLYLMCVALERDGRRAEARLLAEQFVAGVRASGFAEYWNSDTGAACGARPQSWAGLWIALRRLNGE